MPGNPHGAFLRDTGPSNRPERGSLEVVRRIALLPSGGELQRLQGSVENVFLEPSRTSLLPVVGEDPGTSERSRPQTALKDFP